MFCEESDVRAENEPVGVRLEVMSEIGRVIPDVKPIADFSPATDVVAELCVRRGRERFPEIAFDRAEADDDIWPGPDCFGWFARVLVSERVNGNIRELGLDLLRDIVHEIEHRASLTAFGVVDGFAFVALTRAVPVVLGNRDNSRLGRFTQPFLDSLNNKLAEVRVRQAELCMIGGALAVD